MRPAYAIEYECIDPMSLKSNLESRQIENLFCAGQFNGTPATRGGSPRNYGGNQCGFEAEREKTFHSSKNGGLYRRSHRDLTLKYQ